jgi:hypothetical protein
MTSFTDVGKPFPILHDKQTLIEFYTILHVARQVQKSSQKMKLFVLISVYMKMLSMYSNELNITKSIILIDPGKKPENALEHLGTVNAARRMFPVPVATPAHELSLRTTKVRQLPKEALTKRFFQRYHPIKSLKHVKRVYSNNHPTINVRNVDVTAFKYDYVFEMQGLMLPK